MYYVLNKDEQIIGILSSTDGGVPILSDTITTKIADSKASDDGSLAKIFMDTVELELPVGYDTVDALELGYELLTEVEGSWRIYTIDSIEDSLSENGHSKKIEALNSCIWKLNHLQINAKSWSNASSKVVFQYIMERTGWTLDEFNEFWAGGVKKYEISEGTVMSALDSALAEFEVEVDTYVIVKNGNVIDRRILLSKQRGNESNIRFEYSHNLKGVTRTRVYSDFYTKLFVYGGQRSDGKRASIQSVNKVKNKQGIYEYLPYLTADTENDLYNHGRDYLEGVVTNENILNESGLLDWGKQQLKFYNHPKYEYSVDVELLDSEVELGDTVYVIDNEMNPPLTVQARVVETVNSHSKSTEPKVTLGEFNTVKASTPNLIWDLLAQSNQALLLAEQAKNQYRIEYYTPDGTDFSSKDEEKRIIVRVFRGGQNVTSQFPNSAFRWERIDKDGNIDETWGEYHRDTGNTIKTTYLDADYTIRCSVSDQSRESELSLLEEDFIFQVRLEYPKVSDPEGTSRVAQYCNYDPQTNQYYWSQLYKGSELKPEEKRTATNKVAESHTISRTDAYGNRLDRMYMVFGGHGSFFGIKHVNNKLYIYMPYYDQKGKTWYFVRIPYMPNRVVRWGDPIIEVLCKTTTGGFERLNIDTEHGYAVITQGYGEKVISKIVPLADLEKGKINVKHKLVASDFNISSSQTYQSTALAYPYLYHTYGGFDGTAVNNDLPVMMCIDVRTGSLVYQINYTFNKGSIQANDEFHEPETISVYYKDGKKVILQGFAFASEVETETPRYNMIYGAIETVRVDDTDPGDIDTGLD